MATVHLHYWAGARAAAGTADEAVEAGTVRQALELAAAGRDVRFTRVVAACSLLVDGLAVHDGDLDAPLSGPVRVEVLPPFAGGSAAPPVNRVTTHSSTSRTCVSRTGRHPGPDQRFVVT